MIGLGIGEANGGGNGSGVGNLVGYVGGGLEVGGGGVGGSRKEGREQKTITFPLHCSLHAGVVLSVMIDGQMLM